MIWLASLSCFILIALDQWLKHWSVIHLKSSSGIDVIEGFFSLVYVENRGAAFGLMQGWRWLFIPLTLVFSVGIIFYYARLPRTNRYWAIRVPLLLIFSGAIGNFIDRLRLGYVIDMFEFRFIRFPVFNIADICLVTGTFALAFVLLFVIKDDPFFGKS